MHDKEVFDRVNDEKKRFWDKDNSATPYADIFNNSQYLKQLEIEHERIVAQAKASEQQAKLGAMKSVAEMQNQRKMEELRLKQDSIKTVASLENQRMVTKQKLFADGLKAAHLVNKEKPTKGD